MRGVPRTGLAAVAALTKENGRKLDHVIDQVEKNHVIAEQLRKHQTIERVNVLWKSRRRDGALLWASILVPAMTSLLAAAATFLLTR